MRLYSQRNTFKEIGFSFSFPCLARNSAVQFVKQLEIIIVLKRLVNFNMNYNKFLRGRDMISSYGTCIVELKNFLF